MSDNPIPADKGLSIAWLRALTDRGQPETIHGADLEGLTVPVGGIGCGDARLAGDGLLHFGKSAPETRAAWTVRPRGGRERRLAPVGPKGTVHPGYPVASVEIADPSFPVTLRGEFVSPFVPLDDDVSTLPVAFVRWTLTNRGRTPVTLDLIGRLQGGTASRVQRRPGVLARDQGRRAVLALLDPLPTDRDSLARTVVLPPGESRTTTFVVAWRGGRYADALAAAVFAAGRASRLIADTLLWRDTWRDSTLPHWVLERAFAGVPVLATDAFLTADRIPGPDVRARLFPRTERVRCLRASASPEALLGLLATHRMSPDRRFLQTAWPKARVWAEALLGRDADGDGLPDGPQPCAFGGVWSGLAAAPGILFLAGLAAAERLAREAGDPAFADRCRARLAAGRTVLQKTLYNGRYYVHRPDPALSDATGTGDACFADHLRGVSLARALGIDDLLDPPSATTALESVYTLDFAPDLEAWRQRRRPVGMGARAGLVLANGPEGPPPDAPGARHAPWMDTPSAGTELQVAAHLLREGAAQAGMTVLRALHERLRARAPVEAGEDPAHALTGFGVFDAACGVAVHGPDAALTFDPPGASGLFRAAFVAPEGWGTYTQRIEEGAQRHTLEVRRGRVRAATLVLGLGRDFTPTSLLVRAGRTTVTATFAVTGRRVTVTFAKALSLSAGETLYVSFA